MSSDDETARRKWFHTGVTDQVARTAQFGA